MTLLEPLARQKCALNQNFFGGDFCQKGALNRVYQGLEKWIAFRLPGRLAPESDIAFQTPRARGNRRADCRLKSARMPFGIQHSIAHSNIKFQKY